MTLQVADVLNVIRDVKGSITMVDGAVLMVDLSESPAQNTYWIVRQLSAMDDAMINPPVLNAPISGFFRVPKDTPVETIAEGQAATVMNKRGVPIQTQGSFGARGDGLFSAQFTMSASLPVIVSPGETIRHVCACNPGQAGLDPGPGLSTNSKVSATVEIVRVPVSAHL
jgi:hypothetical protein